MSAVSTATCTAGQRYRKNGWNRPIQTLQVVAWVFIIVMNLVYFTTVPQGFPLPGQISCYALVGISTLLTIFFFAVATTIDPADEAVESSQNPRATSFDRNQHSHVIENYFCNICNIRVDPTSKHCATCNKCVVNFDHHCQWLNNCVGARNYREFVTLLVFALTTSLFVFISSLLQFIVYFAQQPSPDSILQQFRDVSAKFNSNHTAGNSTSLPQGSDAQFAVLCIGCAYFVWLVVLTLLWVASLACVGMLLHLLCFHVYLCHKRITTYAHIRHQRSLEEAREKGQTENQVNSSPSQYAIGGNPCCPQKRVQASPAKSCDEDVQTTEASISTIESSSVTFSHDERVSSSRLSFISPLQNPSIDRNGAQTPVSNFMAADNVNQPAMSDSVTMKSKKKRPRSWTRRATEQLSKAVSSTEDNSSTSSLDFVTKNGMTELLFSRSVRNRSEVEPTSNFERPRNSSLAGLPPLPTKRNGWTLRGEVEESRRQRTVSMAISEVSQSETVAQHIPIADFRSATPVHAPNDRDDRDTDKDADADADTSSQLESPVGEAEANGFDNAGYSEHLGV